MELVKVREDSWLYTPSGEPRGYIQPHSLDELWIHTGTHCNLNCSFCLEGAGPNDQRLQAPKFEEVKRFIDEGVELGVLQFSFTGGEPFSHPQIVEILSYASRFRPCLVLTNGTKPLQNLIQTLVDIKNTEEHYPISFRVSIDFPSGGQHDKGRGAGNFRRAMDGLEKLHDAGFSVSVARHMKPEESHDQVSREYQSLFHQFNLPRNTNIVAFPDFMPPGSLPDVPHITESCMTRYQTEEQRDNYMCANSKMVVKHKNRMQVYACTLVDDDTDYALARTLKESMNVTIRLKHHRCYSCFAHGASCSER